MVSEDLRYSFLQFCIHRKLVPKNANDGRLRLAWEVYGNQYVEFCEDNLLISEHPFNKETNLTNDKEKRV